MGRRDSSRRRLGGSNAAIMSDSQLDINRNGFPPGTTVDELRWYSRKKNNERRQDNLHPESGSLKDATSEYARCFKAPPLAAHSMGDLTDDFAQQNIPTLRRYSSHSDDMFKNANETVNNWRSRRNNLKLEGEMMFHTENSDEFIEYVLSKRPDLLRRKTQLKLEGEIDALTENREKYITFEGCKRPSLLKRNTNLHLEGDHIYLPEYRDLYVEFPRKRPTVKRPTPWLRVSEGARMQGDTETVSQFVDHAGVSGAGRPEMVRRPTNLKMEGDLSMLPEYKDSFREYTVVKQCSVKRMPTLKLEGDFGTTPEYRDKYTTLPSNVRLRPTRRFDNVLFDEETTEAKQPPVPSTSVTECGLPVSTDTAMLTKPPTPPKPVSPNKSLTNSESFRKSSSRIRQPLSNVPVDDQRITSRPPRSSRNRVWSPSPPHQQQRKQDSQPKLKHQEPPTNEHEDFIPKYNIYGTYRPQPMRQPDNFGESLESRPEYRKAYLDYLIRQKLPKRDNDDVKENSPTENDHHQTETPHKEIKFETKEDKSNLTVYQPSSRRNSNVSPQTSPRRRSASPSYKMHVTNVDEPKKGFGRRSMSKDLQNVRYGRTRREASLAGYPSQRDNNFDAHQKVSNRSNWIRNIAQNASKEDYNRPSFVVLDEFGDKARSTKRNWETPHWSNNLGINNERVQY